MAATIETDLDYKTCYKVCRVLNEDDEIDCNELCQTDDFLAHASNVLQEACENEGVYTADCYNHVVAANGFFKKVFKAVTKPFKAVAKAVGKLGKAIFSGGHSKKIVHVQTAVTVASKTTVVTVEEITLPAPIDLTRVHEYIEGCVCPNGANIGGAWIRFGVVGGPSETWSGNYCPECSKFDALTKTNDFKIPIVTGSHVLLSMDVPTFNKTIGLRKVPRKFGMSVITKNTTNVDVVITANHTGAIVSGDKVHLQTEGVNMTSTNGILKHFVHHMEKHRHHHDIQIFKVGGQDGEEISSGDLVTFCKKSKIHYRITLNRRK